MENKKNIVKNILIRKSRKLTDEAKVLNGAYNNRDWAEKTADEIHAVYKDATPLSSKIGAAVIVTLIIAIMAALTYKVVEWIIGL